MGNFEKLVVMTILFLTMLVLAVTFHKGEPEDAGSPLDVVARGSSEVLAAPAAPSGSADVERAERDERVERPAGGSGPEGLLSASVRDTERAGAGVAPPLVSASGGRAPIIRDWAGLERGRVDDYCYYTVGAGESFESIAAQIYGDSARVELLMLANEGLAAPVAGKRLFVPVFDHSSARRRPATPVRGTRVAAGDTRPPLGKAADSSVGAKPKPKTGPAADAITEYVVQGGDTLSEISLAVYGTSRRYTEIFEANRDVLASPDVLAEGMVLRIPR